MTTLLIVDDSSVSRMMIKGRVVGLQPDWQIVEASTGAAAVEMVTADYPDFISMDVNMPGMSGFEAIERIRLINSKAKIVVLTANIQESSKEKANLRGVKFVQKPATLAALQQAGDYFVTAP